MIAVMRGFGGSMAALVELPLSIRMSICCYDRIDSGGWMSRLAELRLVAAREDSSFEGRRRREKKAMSLEPDAKNARIDTDSVEKEMDEASAMIAGIFSDDPSSQLESTVNFLKIVSSDITSPAVDEVIQSGVVTRLVEFLKKEDSPKLQIEAAWIIASIAYSYDEPEVVIAQDVVPIFVKLLASPNDDVLGQAIRALGNVAARSVENCDYVLSCGVLLLLLPHLNVNTKLSILKSATWNLATLCCDQPSPPVLHCSLPNDEEVLKDACPAVWLITYRSNDRSQSVTEAGFAPIQIQLLQDASPSVDDLVRSIIFYILSKDNQLIQCMIDCGGLPFLANMLTQNCEEIINRACWITTNITAGTSKQIQSVIDANLIPILVNVAQNAEMDIKMKAVWAISNATKGGSHDQINYLVEQSCIKPLCDLLVCPDLRTIYACLDGLENILKAWKKTRVAHVNYYRQLINDAEGKEKIEDLQSHEHNLIKEKAVKLLKIYWPEQEDEKTLQLLIRCERLEATSTVMRGASPDQCRRKLSCSCLVDLLKLHLMTRLIPTAVCLDKLGFLRLLREESHVAGAQRQESKNRHRLC